MNGLNIHFLHLEAKFVMPIGYANGTAYPYAFDTLYPKATILGKMLYSIIHS